MVDELASFLSAERDRDDDRTTSLMQTSRVHLAWYPTSGRLIRRVNENAVQVEVTLLEYSGEAYQFTGYVATFDAALSPLTPDARQQVADAHKKARDEHAAKAAM